MASPPSARGRHARLAFLLSLAVLALGCAPPAPPSRNARPTAAFTEVTSAAGISFTHDNGAYGQKLFPEIMGAGGAFFDANGDGLLDVFLVNGAPLPGHPQPQPAPSRLYINLGEGRFEDWTAASGLDAISYGMGVAVGDVENDGDDDLYITAVGGNTLYLNDGHGVFTDATEAAGLQTGGFCTSAAFLDYDLDGLLDLYVCRYVDWKNVADDYACYNPRQEKQYCDVHVYEAVGDRLYRNVGDGRFVDVTTAAGIAERVGRGLAVVCGDYDRDGDPDIFVANDETPDFLWRNDGQGHFEEVAAAAGFAYNEAGDATAGMGLDIIDVDGDGDDDVIEADFQDERKTLFVNDGNGFFTPNERQKGLGDMPRDRLAFGIGFLDYDLDGWADIFIANGHVIDDVEEFSSSVLYAQTNQLFRNRGEGQFVDQSAALGSYANVRRVGRGAAFGDYDNDGDVDILVMNNHQPAVLLRNDNPHRHHWLGVRCVGRKANRSGYGVRVTIEAGGRTRSDETRAASSYLSSSDPRLLFGLGDVGRVDRLVVEWPGGDVQEFTDVATDRYITITEGEDVLR